MKDGKPIFTAASSLFSAVSFRIMTRQNPAYVFHYSAGRSFCIFTARMPGTWGIARVFTALMRSVASPCQAGICDLLQLLCKGESWEGGVAGGAGTVTVCAAVNRVGTLVQVGPYR